MNALFIYFLFLTAHYKKKKKATMCWPANVNDLRWKQLIKQLMGGLKGKQQQ